MEKIFVAVRFRPTAPASSDDSSTSSGDREWRIDDTRISLLHRAALVPGASFAYKAAKLQDLQAQVLHNHHSRTYTKEELGLSFKLLEINPEAYTVWNYRKLAFQHNLGELSDPEAIKSLLTKLEYLELQGSILFVVLFFDMVVGLRLLLSPLSYNVVTRTASCAVWIGLPVYFTHRAIEKKDQNEKEWWLLYWAVSAINGLYVALGSPTIPGWTANGGDPCGERWQGVVCIGSNIDSIIFNAANLGGQLGSLGNFTSITTIYVMSRVNHGGIWAGRIIL